MGFAIIVIVLFHFFNVGGTTMADKIMRGVFSQGYVGVDIFMVVSGLGLTFSMLKDDNLKRYYLKRWIRIFPFFTFITLIECWLIRGESFGLALLRSTTLGYWFGFPYIDWYIPALVGLYVVFPLLFHHIVKPRRYLVALIVGFSFLVLGIAASYRDLIGWKHLALVYRVPDFLIGSMAAVAIKDGYDTRKIVQFVLISVTLGVLIALIAIFKLGGGFYWLWFVNLCFTPLYLIVLCLMFKKLSTLKLGSKMVLAPLAFHGLFTLELYRISSSFERLLTNEACPEQHVMFVLLYFVVSVLLSWMSYLIFKRINNFLYQIMAKII